MICNFFVEPSYFLFAPDIPGLLYYSHIPTAIIALLVGGFVFLKGRQFLLNRLLLVIAICFALWTFTNLVLWTNIHSDFLLFIWTGYVVLFSFISISSVYFVYVFLEGKDVSLWLKGVFLALLTPVLVLAPTYINLGGFNITSCDAFEFEGFAYKFYYIALAVLAMIWILVLLIKKYRAISGDFRKQIVLMGIGIEFFLFSFFTITSVASYLTDIGVLSDSRLEFYGLFGMTVFMVFIGILMVRFKIFHVGLIASQALVVALVILVGSQFTYVNTTTGVILTAVTLLFTGLVGILLMKSARKEIEQREKIEKLAGELAATNERQETLIHFIGHEVKGFLTKAAGSFASLAEGDFAPLPEALKPFVGQALAETRGGVDSVSNILKASNLKKGTVTYTKEPFDMKALVTEAVGRAKLTAEQKGLTIRFAADDASYQMTGDKAQINDHVLRNLIDNAINYTPSGSIEVSLKRQGTRIIFAVKDSGVGITEEDKKRLFTEGGHGADSQKINVHSTGYGLYIAKQIVEAHGGTIRAESEGAGKGSTFIVELPV
ncbi:MAG: ATP-binding protein [Candidatus Pacebacteria bacterium]|nr:ATP-binding protein [Candidatus Paceibacterota bacterium]